MYRANEIRELAFLKNLITGMLEAGDTEAWWTELRERAFSGSDYDTAMEVEV